MTCTEHATHDWEIKDFRNLNEAIQHLFENGMSHHIELIIRETTDDTN